MPRQGNRTGEIMSRLLSGEPPYSLVKQGFSNAAVYAVFNTLVADGKLNDPNVFANVRTQGKPVEIDTDGEEVKVAVSAKSGKQQKQTRDTADTVDLNVNFSEDAIARVRGIMGIAAVPKVLRMAMPEMLYPAMVISVSEFGWPVMKPDDFIDTVLYQWLEACDFIPNVFIRKSELQKLIDDNSNGNGHKPVVQVTPNDTKSIREQMAQSISNAEEYTDEEDEELDEPEGEISEPAVIQQQSVEPVIDPQDIDERKLQMEDMHYRQGMTYEEIGNKFDITRQRVEQIVNKPSKQSTSDVSGQLQQAVALSKGMVVCPDCGNQIPDSVMNLHKFMCTKNKNVINGNVKPKSSIVGQPVAPSNSAVEQDKPPAPQIQITNVLGKIKGGQDGSTGSNQSTGTQGGTEQQ